MVEARCGAPEADSEEAPLPISIIAILQAQLATSGTPAAPAGTPIEFTLRVNAAPGTPCPQ